MDPKHLQGLMEAYSEVYAPIDENRMASRMEKMPSAPAKVGKATHSTKDLAPSKPPTPEEKAKARKALGLGEAITSEKGKAKAAEMIAARTTASGRAKSGKGANVAQIRQIRGSGRGDFDREGLGGTPMTPTMAKNPVKKKNYFGTGNKAARRAGTYKESFNIFVNSMIAEGVSMERYTWEEIQNVFDDLFEAEVANRDPDEYERKAKQGQSREQQLKGRVMGRMNQMDPDKKAAMLKQMRAAGLDV